MRIIATIVCILIINNSSFAENTINYSEIPAYSDLGMLQMVIEIPAGTNKKLEYNYETNSFMIDKIAGRPRIIEFLPYVGNYGFIPSTNMHESEGGDGDALDILLISESRPTGSIIRVIPVALLKLEDNGEIDSKIIAVPADPKDRIISAISFGELNSQFPNTMSIIKQWFLNYKKTKTVKFKGWGDELEAIKAIETWTIKRYIN